MEFITNKPLDYVHMDIKRLENIIRIFEYQGNTEEVKKLVKIFNKRVNERYNPEMNRKNKVKMLSKYNKGGKSNGKY